MMISNLNGNSYLLLHELGLGFSVLSPVCLTFLLTFLCSIQYLREDLLRIDESWAATRFDSLPHVVHILTSKDREGEARLLKEQSDIIEDVVDEVVHAYHSGFNKAIQNYSQVSSSPFSLLLLF